MLGQAIESVLSQSWRDLELIVVDDDPEGSAEPVVTSFDDERLSYVANDHERGGAGTRNAGIHRSRGTWVAFLDDDDVWLPEKLARQASLIRSSDGDLGLVYSGSAIYDFERHEVVSERHCEKAGRLAHDLLARNWIGGLFSVVIRRDLLLEVGGLDERFPALQDLDLFVRVARHCTVDYVDEPLVLVRKDNGDRITRNARKKLCASLLFNEKYRSEIEADPRLRHRAAARLFTYGVAARDIPAVVRSLPWMAAGIVVDPPGIRQAVARLLRQLRYERSKRSKATGA